MTVLMPHGITHLADMPVPIHDAIMAGLQFASYDELPDEERPPRKIWWDKDAMRTWWTMVERKRDEKYGTGDKPPAGTSEERNALVEELVV